MEPVYLEEQVSMTVDDSDIVIGDSEVGSACSSYDQFGIFARSGMTRADDGNSEHEIITRSFLRGMGVLAKETDVVAVHRNSGSTGRARMEAFRIYSEAVGEKSGGRANIKYAWYGGSRDEICEIVNHGFSRSKKPGNSQSYGVGVHLSPVKFAADGAVSSVVDENGLRHVLLCRVILGNTERVCAGSEQLLPSSKEFDSGVDNISAPTTYIIWNAYMNSHILPLYIVSFRAPSCIRGFGRIPIPFVKPNSPYMKFHTLLSKLSRFLPRLQMRLMDKCYSDYRENKLSRLQLIRTFREIAGDELLVAVIKRDRNKQLVSDL